MSASPVYRPYPEQPATTRLSRFDTQGAWSGLRGHHFEVVSRGDFVPGSLFLPPVPTPSPAPLVLVQHGAGGSRQSPYLECAARWVRDGLAVALIDLPLHGARSSPKLSERLIASVDRVARDEELDSESAVLLEEFARQSTSDLVRTIDALAACDEIDDQRIGFVGFSLGGVVGSYLLAHDTRPRVAVLALAGGGRGPMELDPATHIAAARSRPLLFLAAEGDRRVALQSARCLFEAAREPKEFVSVVGDHGGLPGKALARIQSFLTEGLEGNQPA
jgi:dienelactone hydrolase